jgi:hypothetical protein
MKSEISQKYKQQAQSMETENEHLKSQLQEMERQMKQRDEDYKNLQNMKEKDEALTLQKIQFLEMQLQESKNAIEDNRSAHSQMLQAFQRIEDEKSKINKESTMKVDEIQAKYRSQLEEMDNEQSA